MLGAGPEPADTDFREATQGELLSALNWYNYVFTPKDARTHFEKAYKKIDWNRVPHARQFLTFAWIDKMIGTGCQFPPDLLRRKAKYFAEMEKDFPKVKAPKVQEIPKEETGPTYTEKRYLAEFDDIEDMIIRDGDFKGAEQAFKVLVTSNPKYANEEITERVKKLLGEITSKDRDIREGFSHLSTKDKKAYAAFYEFCLKHIDFIYSAKKALKPRKPKIVPIEKKLKNLKFKKTDQALGLASVDPEKLLGAKILWTFNTKYRELARFESKGGFDLKGTTLQNVDKSAKKRIRKPEEMKTFFSGTKAGMDKSFDAIKTTQTSHNCRINEETLIMKVF